jgi:tetratricopeptide (TPR) repeat protein
MVRAAGSSEKALAILREARELDPHCAAVAVEIAATILAMPVVDRLPDAREQLAAALGRVPTARAFRLLAKLRARFDADWRGAEQALRAALEIEPSSSSAHMMIGDLLLVTGRPTEAAQHHRAVAEMMPVDERAQIAAAFESYFGRESRTAAAWLAEVSKRFAGATDWLVRALVVDGDVLGARQHAASPFARALVASSTGEATRSESFSAYEAALICSAAGRIEETLAYLERAAAEHCDEVMFAGIEPLFGNLHGDGRFHALLSRLGLR